MSFHSGFISIVGKPNVGKSTLMNALMGHQMAIVTHKAQTTRHRIKGILNGPEYQIIYSDTPGILEPHYTLHKVMMGFVKTALADADLVLLIVEHTDFEDALLLKWFREREQPIVIAINKSDTIKKDSREKIIATWSNSFPNAKQIVFISALKGDGLDDLKNTIVDHLPEHPAYFPTDEDEISDLPQRFFASEILREKIFMNFSDEIPYSTEVIITSFKEEEAIIKISAEIFVERESQKPILIGKGGEAIKNLGIAARKDLENFFQKQIFLETRVKVADDWRKMPDKLKQFGYTK